MKIQLLRIRLVWCHIQMWIIDLKMWYINHQINRLSRQIKKLSRQIPAGIVISLLTLQGLSSQQAYEFIRVTAVHGLAEPIQDIIPFTSDDYHVVVLAYDSTGILKITGYHRTDTVSYADRYAAEILTQFCYGQSRWHDFWFSQDDGIWEFTEYYTGGSQLVYDTADFQLDWVIIRRQGQVFKHLVAFTCSQILLETGEQLTRTWDQPR